MQKFASYTALGLLRSSDGVRQLSVPCRSTNLNNSTARAHCSCSGCGSELSEYFSLLYHLFIVSVSKRQFDTD